MYVCMYTYVCIVKFMEGGSHFSLETRHSNSALVASERFRDVDGWRSILASPGVRVFLSLTPLLV